LSLLVLIILAFAIPACDAAPTNASESSHSSDNQEKIEERQEIDQALLDKLVADALEETGLVRHLYCPYCYSVVGEAVTICDSCGMDTRNDALVEMTSAEIKNTPIINCSSCEKAILESSIACKYCKAEQ
jgi:hypothetical protein